MPRRWARPWRPKARTNTLGDIAKGRVDIVIATHSLLKKGIEFRDLGLLVIDEEHRFGVGQKERIKELQRGVDVLALSASVSKSSEVTARSRLLIVCGARAR